MNGPRDARTDGDRHGERHGEPSTCPLCRSKELLSVSLRLSDGEVSFTHCNRCEWREWERRGRRMPLGAVLERVPPRERARKR
jgi:hypothetical protein